MSKENGRLFLPKTPYYTFSLWNNWLNLIEIKGHTNIKQYNRKLTLIMAVNEKI
jgi:hypothetical protein